MQDNKKKLIIFDFDGTLGDTKQNIVTTMQMTIRELQLPERTDEQCAATIGLPLAGCFRLLYPGMAEENIMQCATVYRRIFAENLHTMSPQPFPQVVETLHRLKEQGFTMTIASSRAHVSLVRLCGDMGIADCMSLLIGADDVEHAKPDPEPVLKTLEAMGCSAADTLVVGDMAVDILMGAGAGTETCGVTWGNGTEEELTAAGADHIIHSMEELLFELRRFSSAARKGKAN